MNLGAPVHSEVYQGNLPLMRLLTTGKLHEVTHSLFIATILFEPDFNDIFVAFWELCRDATPPHATGRGNSTQTPGGSSSGRGSKALIL